MQNEDFKDFKFLLYSKRLLDQYEVWSKEIDNLMVKEQELTSFNEIFFLAKIRRVHTEFLKDLKDKNLIEIISKCWSRVRIVSFSSERNVKMVRRKNPTLFIYAVMSPLVLKHAKKRNIHRKRIFLACLEVIDT